VTETPWLVLSALAVQHDQYLWRPIEQSRPLSLSCRCSRARVLRPVLGESGFNVPCARKLYCGNPTTNADVLRECMRCESLVAIRSPNDRRRDTELLCGFDAIRSAAHRAAVSTQSWRSSAALK
jgi:hypothetical protein